MQVVPGVIHDDGVGLERERQGMLRVVVAVMVERVERPALYLLAIVGNYLGR